MNKNQCIGLICAVIGLILLFCAYHVGESVFGVVGVVFFGFGLFIFLFDKLDFD